MLMSHKKRQPDMICPLMKVHTTMERHVEGMEPNPGEASGSISQFSGNTENRGTS